MKLTRSDAANCYRVILGREPESDYVIDDKLRHPRKAVLLGFFLSDEFNASVVTPLVAGERLGSEGFQTAPSPWLRAWTAAFLPLTPEGQAGVRRAQQWVAIFSSLFSDADFVRDVAPGGLHGVACSVLAAAAQDQVERPSPCWGRVEWSGLEEVRGWAVSLAEPDQGLTLQLNIDGRPSGFGATGLYRSDLQARFGGDGQLGFAFSRPEGVDWPRNRLAALEDRATGRVLDTFRVGEGQRPPVRETSMDLTRIRTRLSEVERRTGTLSAGLCRIVRPPA